MKKVFNYTIKIAVPLLIGVALMVWLYHDFDFSTLGRVLLHDIDWWWMTLSLLFGVAGYALRGLRCRQLLEPLGVRVSNSFCVNSVYFSYMANIVIPRFGEISRSGLMKKYEGVPFVKSLGTMVTERIIDTICIFLLLFASLFICDDFFAGFMEGTGMSWGGIMDKFSNPLIYIIFFAILAVLIAMWKIFGNFKFFDKLRSMLSDMKKGIGSVLKVRSPLLFIFYTIGIWTCYFFHFYLTFYSFGFTQSLGVVVGLATFVLGSFAVIVPTPNGAGPWHYVVIVALTMCGVSKSDAGIFALIVHSIQTFLIVLLGIYSMLFFQLKYKLKL